MRYWCWMEFGDGCVGDVVAVSWWWSVDALAMCWWYLDYCLVAFWCLAMLVMR